MCLSSRPQGEIYAIQNLVRKSYVRNRIFASVLYFDPYILELRTYLEQVLSNLNKFQFTLSSRFHPQIKYKQLFAQDILAEKQNIFIQWALPNNIFALLVKQEIQI